MSLDCELGYYSSVSLTSTLSSGTNADEVPIYFKTHILALGFQKSDKKRHFFGVTNNWGYLRNRGFLLGDALKQRKWLTYVLFIARVPREKNFWPATKEHVWFLTSVLIVNAYFVQLTSQSCIGGVLEVFIAEVLFDGA